MEDNITVTIPIELYNQLLSYKINLDESFKTNSIAIVECKFLLKGNNYFYKILTKDDAIETLTKANNELSEKCNKFGDALRNRSVEYLNSKPEIMAYPKGFWNRFRWFLSL